MAAIHHGNDAAADAFQRETDIEGIAVNAVAPGSIAIDAVGRRAEGRSLTNRGARPRHPSCPSRRDWPAREEAAFITGSAPAARSHHDQIAASAIHRRHAPCRFQSGAFADLALQDNRSLASSGLNARRQSHSSPSCHLPLSLGASDRQRHPRILRAPAPWSACKRALTERPSRPSIASRPACQKATMKFP